MNVRALALGAMVGFVVAIAPACSPPKCGPSNCDGCCDSSGACVQKPNNGNNTTCGSAGNACDDCGASNSTCNPATNTCITGGTGGGSGGGSGGGGGNTCDGCRLTTGTCVPLSTTSINNCGKEGNRCQACTAGQICSNGECMTPPPVVTVGSRCTADTECQATLGAQARCRTATSSGSGAYPGGYCTIECGAATGNTCPTGSACVSGVEEYGETQVCWKLCNNPNTIGGACGTGYACYGLSGNSGGCWIYPAPERDAGPPADKVGIACTDDSQCINPPENGGVCLTREFNYNWEALNGYCSRDNCAENADCSADGGAICLGFSETAAACVALCSEPTVDGGAHQSDCRNGFICEAYQIRSADGGITNSPNGFCVPPEAPAVTSIGEACNVDADCSVPTGAIADCFPPTQPDGGATPYRDGYCTRFECDDDSDCGDAPTDGGTRNRCLFSQQGNQVFSFCYKGCNDSTAGAVECRPGYTCSAYGLGDGGRSLDGYCNVACDAPGVGACPSGSTCNATTGYCTLPDGGIR